MERANSHTLLHRQQSCSGSLLVLSYSDGLPLVHNTLPQHCTLDSSAALCYRSLCTLSLSIELYSPWFSMAATVYQHALGIQFLYCCLILGKMNSTRIISQDSRHCSPASLKCRLAGVIRGHHMQVLRGWGL